MKKYPCYFEREEKNIYLSVSDLNSVLTPISITNHQGENNLIEVCLTREQAENLVTEIQSILNNNKTNE